MLLLAVQSNDPGAWWWSTLTSGTGMVLLGLIVGFTLLLALLSWRLRQTGVMALAENANHPTGLKGLAKRLADDSGTATVEFVLVTPILLTITLLLVQTTLVFTGLFYVNYAAFAAARSAIVYVPLELDDPANAITTIEGGTKFDRIRSAAIIALIPVSGEEAGTFPAADQIIEGLRSAHESLGQTTPGWVDNLLPGRLSYAANHTEVTLYEVVAEENGSIGFITAAGYYEFGPKDAIAAEVRHEMALTIPIASQIFTAASGNSGSYTTRTRDNDSPGPPGRWTEVTARYVLSNQGIERPLPDAPPVPRRE